MRRRASAPPPHRCWPPGAPPSPSPPGGPIASRPLLAALPGDGHVALPADLGEPDAAAERSPTDAAAAIGHLDVVVHNAAMPKRRHVTALTPGRGRRDDGAELPRAGAHDARHAARHARARPGLPRLRVEPGRPPRHRPRGGLLRHRSSPSRAGPRRWPSTCGTRPSTSASCCPAPSTPRSGTSPATTAPLYDGPLEPPSTVAEAIADAIEGDAFELLQPRHEGDRRVEDGRPRRVPRRRRRDGAARPPAVKALVFGDAPRPAAAPAPAPDAPRLVRHLAVDADGAARRARPRAAGPDWAVLRTRLTGICGSDTKQVLMDFEDADDSPDDGVHLVPPGARPRGGRHRRGGRARRRRRAGPAGRAQPVAVVRGPRHRRRCARRARPATSACAGTSTTATSRPASTPATRPTPPAASPSCCRRTGG